jgi:tetrahydromethanopterin S-methyltransferase subunit B
MICSFESSSPTLFRFAEEGLEGIEKKFRPLDFFWPLSSFTGTIEILAGTVAAVYSLALRTFCSVAAFIPFISKDFWSDRKVKDDCLILLRNSITMIALGIVHTIPGGGMVMEGIYKFKLDLRALDEKITKLAQTPPPAQMTHVESAPKTSENETTKTDLLSISQRVDKLTTLIEDVTKSLDEKITKLAQTPPPTQMIPVESAPKTSENETTKTDLLNISQRVDKLTTLIENVTKSLEEKITKLAQTPPTQMIPVESVPEMSENETTKEDFQDLSQQEQASPTQMTPVESLPETSENETTKMDLQDLSPRSSPQEENIEALLLRVTKLENLTSKLGKNLPPLKGKVTHLRNIFKYQTRKKV